MVLSPKVQFFFEKRDFAAPNSIFLGWNPKILVRVWCGVRNCTSTSVWVCSVEVLRPCVCGVVFL